MFAGINDEVALQVATETEKASMRPGVFAGINCPIPWSAHPSWRRFNEARRVRRDQPPTVLRRQERRPLASMRPGVFAGINVPNADGSFPPASLQ